MGDICLALALVNDSVIMKVSFLVATKPWTGACLASKSPGSRVSGPLVSVSVPHEAKRPSRF